MKNLARGQVMAQRSQSQKGTSPCPRIGAVPSPQRPWLTGAAMSSLGQTSRYETSTRVEKGRQEKEGLDRDLAAKKTAVSKRTPIEKRPISIVCRRPHCDSPHVYFDSHPITLVASPLADPLAHPCWFPLHIS